LTAFSVRSQSKSIAWILSIIRIAGELLARTDQSLAIRFREGSQRWAREAG
jgi:hypothetical protein